MKKTDGLTWGLVDLLTALMIVFMALAALALIPQKKAEQTSQHGKITIELWWKKGIDSDVDLWVQAPNERPVGYSNMGGRTLNLLRDDRGISSDPDSRNYEVIFGQGAPNGEYVVNAHDYSSFDHNFPIELHLIVSVDNTVIINVTNKLLSEGQEITLVRFTLEKGQLVPDSINYLFKPLRGAQ